MNKNLFKSNVKKLNIDNLLTSKQSLYGLKSSELKILKVTRISSIYAALKKYRPYEGMDEDYRIIVDSFKTKLGLPEEEIWFGDVIAFICDDKSNSMTYEEAKATKALLYNIFSKGDGENA